MYVFYWLIQITFITQLWLRVCVYVCEWVSECSWCVSPLIFCLFVVVSFLGALTLWMNRWVGRDQHLHNAFQRKTCNFLKEREKINSFWNFSNEIERKNKQTNKQKHLIMWSIHCNIRYIYVSIGIKHRPDFFPWRSMFFSIVK